MSSPLPSRTAEVEVETAGGTGAGAGGVVVVVVGLVVGLDDCDGADADTDAGPDNSAGPDTGREASGDTGGPDEKSSSSRSCSRKERHRYHRAPSSSPNLRQCEYARLTDLVNQ